MARVTVTDCLANVENRFELVLVAAKRARQLLPPLGLAAKVEAGNNKPTVVALREIAAGEVGAEILAQSESSANAEAAFDETDAADQTKIKEDAATISAEA